jgi:hypothetical protein
LKEAEHAGRARQRDGEAEHAEQREALFDRERDSASAREDPHARDVEEPVERGLAEKRGRVPAAREEAQAVGEALERRRDSLRERA